MTLTFEQQKIIKEISLNNKKMFEQISKEVADFELCKLLGILTYQSISDDDDDLFLGCEFEYDNKTYSHLGLNYVWAYLNYSRYIQRSSIADTFTGMVQKTREDSQLISQGVLKSEQTYNREIAFNAFELVKKYMELNPDKYPNFKRCPNKTIYSPRFSSISKTLG